MIPIKFGLAFPTCHPTGGLIKHVEKLLGTCLQLEAHSGKWSVSFWMGPPRKKPDDGDDWLRPKEVGMFKDPEQARREAQHQAEFAAEMTPSREPL